MYMRFKNCQECPQHIQVRDKAADLLTTVGFFSKEEVCKALGLSSFIDSIRWDYILRMIEEEYKTELIAMGKKFFAKRRNLEKEIHFPEQYIAGGHGKRTAGYTIASQENGHFLVQRLKQKRAVWDGLGAKVVGTEALRVQLGVPSKITSIEQIRPKLIAAQ